jgi:predicted ATPase/DNA-binding winged helix-turn-helix (wHTH) protein
VSSLGICRDVGLGQNSLLVRFEKVKEMTTPKTEAPGDVRQAAWVASFGPFRLSAKERLLEKDGVPVHLGGRALSLLITLVDAANEVVSKRDLIARVWPDVVVEEGSLRVHMVAVRKALGDGESGARYVSNVAGQGYCFVAPITHAPQSSAGAQVALSHGLPAALARMVGRDATVTLIQAELTSKRFVTIVGPGGIGKTTVAVSAAWGALPAFEGAVRFIDLAPVNDAALVPSTIAATLGLLGHATDPVSTIVNFLLDKHMLLVLDNCEHVGDVVAGVVERIFKEAPQVHLLATSRESLRVEGEQVHRLLPLECPPPDESVMAEQALSYPAVQLFVERAAAGAAKFSLGDADAHLVAKICRELDGIALAIELAAGGLDAYGVQGIADLLDRHIKLLWHGRRTAVPRHQTMRAALEWSYNLLSVEERRVLGRLSVFVGIFSLEAAVAVAGDREIDEAAVVLTIANLVAKSLLATDAKTGSTAMCYRLLDTTRVYALEKLIESGESDATASRHARYYRSVLEQAGPAVAQHAEALGNVRAALTWSLSDGGDLETGTALAAAAAPLLLGMSLLSECREWTKRAIASLDDATRGSRREMELQASLGLSHMFTKGNSEEVRSAYSRSLELARALQDLAFESRLLGGLGAFLLRMGDFREALEVIERGDSVARRTGDPVAVQTAGSMLGLSLELTGDIVSAEQRRAVALVGSGEAQRIRTVRMGFDPRVNALCGQARCHWLRGRCDQAATVASYAIKQAELLDHPVALCIALIWAGSVFLWRGDWSREEEVIDRLLTLATKHSLSPYVAVAKGLKGEVNVQRGQAEVGVQLLQDSLQAVHADRYEMRTGVFLNALAEGLNNSQNHLMAMTTIDEASALIERSGGYLNMSETLRVKGEILAGTPGTDKLVEQCFHGAIDLARRQSALSFELRAASSLARVWLRRGRTESAAQLLAPVYGAFTEGHDTRDLLEARRVLAECGLEV